jgi:hypothetical protein
MLIHFRIAVAKRTHHSFTHSHFRFAHELGIVMNMFTASISLRSREGSRATSTTNNTSSRRPPLFSLVRCPEMQRQGSRAAGQPISEACQAPLSDVSHFHPPLPWGPRDSSSQVRTGRVRATRIETLLRKVELCCHPSSRSNHIGKISLNIEVSAAHSRVEKASSRKTKESQSQQPSPSCVTARSCRPLTILPRLCIHGWTRGGGSLQ